MKNQDWRWIHRKKTAEYRELQRKKRLESLSAIHRVLSSYY